MDVDDEEFLGVREAARRLGVHENTVRNWARTGVLAESQLPGSRFRRFRASEVARLVAQRGQTAPSLQTERRVVNPELVNANQLKQWPSTRARDAQENFPELVRRLLVETPGITNISVRSGDGIALLGWDGRADSLGSDFLPSGELAFEFGVDKDPKRKATDDYDNRATATPSAKTFVFVTPHRWAGGPAWADERRAEGHFADVRVVDGDDLEGWLRASPGAHHWISEHLGLRPRDASTLDSWWDHFSTSTDPVLPPNLFLAGRGPQADELVKRLVDAPKLIVVESEWTDDALAFIHAALYSRDAETSAGIAPALVVRSPEVWGRILEQPGTATLIPQFDRADVGAALDKGHHVISVIDRTAASLRAVDVTLPRLERRAAADAFQAGGVEFGKADRLATQGRRSLRALVRQISRNPSFQRPAWTQQPDAALLAPLVLVGTWTTTDEDIAVVERFTGLSWTLIEQTVDRLSSSVDPVLRKTGNQWAFVSPEEAFLLLRDALTSRAVKRWRAEVTNVLLASDPMPALTPEERFNAQITGDLPSHSATLRRGLAQGVALMGTMGAATTPDGITMLSEIGASVVQSLLYTANADSSGGVWKRLADVLALLAEAAPERFLDAVEDDLTSNPPVLRHLFRDRSDSAVFGPTSLHHHLLWALERLAWSEQHLVGSIRALARLAAVEPGGKSGNRPSESMASILCGWIRHTSAPIDVRLRALDVAFGVSDSVGWQLVLDLLPQNHALVIPPATPRFRDDWLPGGLSVPMIEWVTLVHELVDRALDCSKRTPARLAQLIDRLPTVPPADRDRIITMLAEQAQGELDSDGRLQVWETLQALVARHERFATAAWAMPEIVRQRLSELASLFEPRTDPQRFAYLFEWHPDLRGVDQADYQSYSVKLDELRNDAIRSILRLDNAFEHLARLAARVTAPTHLGWTLAEHDEANLERLLPWLESEEPALREAAATWVRRRTMRQGVEWLEAALNDPRLQGDARLLLIRQIPPRAEFWTALSNSPCKADEHEYWTTAPVDAVEPADTATALVQLLAHKRAWAAVAVASHAISHQPDEADAPASIGPGAIINVLDAALAQPPGVDELSQMTAYYVGHLLDYLAATKEWDQEVARFEYAYFRLLEHHRAPTVLNQALATQPEIFVDFVVRAYRGRGEARREHAETERNEALQAWSVLDGWEGFPGRKADGGIDITIMNEWVRTARLNLSDADRADIGDELIGQTFAYSPNGTDGVWPAEPVRDLIETIGSRDLENGLVVGRRNSRGVTTRGVYEGGAQERVLAGQYREWSAIVQAEWPRTARILRDLSEAYEREARREDVEAEIDADRF